MPFHISVAIFSCGNGKYRDEANGIEGSPMPFVIHSGTSGKKNNKSAREKRMDLYDQSLKDKIYHDENYMQGFDPKNPANITVRHSLHGSMVKENFYDACAHFVKGLPAHQGKEGQWCFLLLDSHVSRWSPNAIDYLFKNCVMPIYFPSHLSIVVQPQDNGVISFFQLCMANACAMDRLFKDEADLAYFNRIIEKALIEFWEKERKKLQDRGSNSTTRAWNKQCGLHPQNPYCDNWRESLKNYGTFNALKIEMRNLFQPRAKDGVGKHVIPDEDLRIIQEERPNLGMNGDPINVAESIADEFLIKCYQICSHVIQDWVESPYDSRSLAPKAVSEAQMVAMKYIDIIEIPKIEPDPGVWSYKEVLDTFEDAKRDALLTTSKPQEAIQVKRALAASNEDWMTAIKTENDGEWMLVKDDEYVLQKYLTTPSGW